MLDAYLENMKQEYADKETNTDCAFPPEKLRSQSQLLDDRPVKRSQTFTPSAAISKNRYNCRLNRSDSDSAMHFGVTPHTFHRGAVERRSLRFHPKATKSATSKFPKLNCRRTTTKRNCFLLCRAASYSHTTYQLGLGAGFAGAAQ